MIRAKKLTILAIIAMVLTMLPIQLFAAATSGTSSRLSGTDRVQTALQVCSEGWTTANTVIVAPADQDNLVDALAAAPLAGQESAPILLTFKGALDSAVKAEIATLGAKKVYVIGAISDNVKNEIAAMSGVTVETLKGSNRWETTKAINAKLTNPAGTFVVGYAALADALSVSSYAAAHKYAIVLADANGAIPSGQTVSGSMTYLIGGPALVADITGATRLAGADRFATNQKILETLSFDYSKVYVANGYDNHLVDSLVAAPLAAKANASIVLADNSAVAAANYVNGKISAASSVIALGGTGVVADSVRDSIKYNTPSTFAVDSIEPISLNAFEVVFNQAVDKDSAENEINYKVDSVAVNASGAANGDLAVLQSDEKTVIVTLGAAVAPGIASQYQKNTVEVVGNTVLNKAKTASAGSSLKQITMSDVTVPTVQSVVTTGNTRITVNFSEPVLLPTLALVQNWQLDGVALSSAGVLSVNTTQSTRTAANAAEYGSKVVINFSVPIAAGSHTLAVKAGQSAVQLADAAGFIVAAQNKDFTVDAVTGSPSIVSVTSSNNTIYAEFDRAMYDDPTAPDTADSSVLAFANYNINDKGTGANAAASNSLSAAPSFKSGSGNKIVTLTADAGIISTGINVITIDKDIKDAWGNKLSAGQDNIRMQFTYAADTTKPTISSVSCVSSTKIRVQFSESVNYAFAETTGNYKLKDANGGVIAISGASMAPTAGNNSNTVELTPASALNGSNYTLEIKNIQDLAVYPNVMDTYSTTFNGIDTVGPTLKEVVVSAGSTSKAVAFFSEALDSASVIVENFGYTDGAGVYNALPSGATVTLDGTGKIVTIALPAAYKVQTAAGGTNDKYEVNAIRVSNVKDKTGNFLQGVAMTVNVAAPTDAVRPTITATSFNLYNDGSNVRAEFTLNQEVNTLVIDDFTVGTTAGGFAAGTVADIGYTEGNKVILKFTDPNKVKAVKALGVNAYVLSDVQGNLDTTNTAGIAVLAFNAAGYQVYDDKVAPVIDSSVAIDFTSGDGVAVPAAKAMIVMTFSEAIDPSIVGLYADDFTFSASGRGLTPQQVIVSGNTITFDLGDKTGLAGTALVKAVSAKVDIRDMKDSGAKDYNKYVPSATDQTGRSSVAFH